MLLRRLARPLFAVAFVAEGIDAARHPDAHVDRVETAWRQLSRRADLPAPPPREDLVTLARVHGAATAVVGLMLASGRAPRTSALALALLTLPRLAVEEPFSVDDSSGEQRRRFLTTLSLVGGALIAAADTAGRPSLAWRAQHARVGKDAAKDARIALLEARRDASKAVAEARRETKQAVASARREAGQAALKLRRAA